MLIFGKSCVQIRFKQKYYSFLKLFTRKLVKGECYFSCLSTLTLWLNCFAWQEPKRSAKVSRQIWCDTVANTRFCFMDKEG